jgi:HEAT repeat protein
MKPLVSAVALLLVLVMLIPAQEASGQTKKEKISSIRNAGKQDSHAIDFLQKYLKDPDFDVRNEAVKAIVNVGTQYSLDPLIEATHDNDAEIQLRAVDGLVNFYVPGYVTTGGVTRTFTRVSKRIKDVFSNRNDDVIGPSVIVRPEVIAAIGTLIGAGASVDCRAQAARAAGILRGHAALPELEKALQSKDTTLIFESLVAIQKIGDTSAGSSVEFLASDFDPQVQAIALETLGVLHATDAAPRIRQVANRPKNSKVLHAALEALAMLGQPEDRNLFLQYKDDKSAESRAAALEGLGRIRDPQDFPTLEKAFDGEKDLLPRLAAAFALVSEGKVDTSEFSPLRYLVNGLDLSKGESAAQAYLEELTRKTEVRTALLPLLATATKPEKLGLIHALAPNADGPTQEAIEKLKHDPDPDVSIAASRQERIVKARQP